MEKIRIGNDIAISWRVERLGKGMNLTSSLLFWILPSGKRCPIHDVIKEDSTLKFCLSAEEQAVYGLGVYGLLLVGRYGDKTKWTIDSCEALRLVSHSCYESAKEDVKHVELTNNLQIPANGLSAYEMAVLHGFEGTEEEWLKSIVQPSLDAAAAAGKATNAANDAAKSAGEVTQKAVEATEEAGKATSAANDAAKNADKATQKTVEATEAAGKATNAANDAAKNAGEAAQKTVEATEAAGKATNAANDAAKSANTSAESARLAAQAASSAAANANGAAALANVNTLAIVFDDTTGKLDAVTGADGSAFTKGEITPQGNVVLTFDY